MIFFSRRRRTRSKQAAGDRLQRRASSALESRPSVWSTRRMRRSTGSISIIGNRAPAPNDLRDGLVSYEAPSMNSGLYGGNPQESPPMTSSAFTPSSLAAWDGLDAHKFRDEREAVAANLARTPLDAAERVAVVAEATALVEHARRSQKKQGVVESFLQQFSLGTREGLALMCLAEALLRVPDEETRDRLIAEKIGSAHWASHPGQADNPFVHAPASGLM